MTRLLRFMMIATSIVALPCGNASTADPGSSPPRSATAVATFHCLSLYWMPDGGAAGKQVLVKFREAGEKVWHDGLPMRYNPVSSPECKGDYRGSIVNLKPGTTYEIQLTLEGTTTRTTLTAATWSEKFPIASTVKCASSDSTLVIKESGTADGYVLYDGTGCTIDGANKIDLGISVDASYVILRGFTIRNVREHGIRLMTGHHIVIEQCDISKWGTEDEKGFGVNYQGAIYSNNEKLCAIVIQRNKLHHPSWDSNSWAEEHNKTRHPGGPQAVVFWESEGNHVIRYNECWSDEDHYFNDIIGAGRNGSHRGFPGADCDVYGNYFANCWDDGIESEGGNQNVRIWTNYIENTLMSMGNAATSIGPLYVWRNVAGRSYSPPGSEYGLTHGYFMKMGFAGSDKWMTGHLYVFNNTIFQAKDDGPHGLGGTSKPIRHCLSRNNILHVRSTDSHSIATRKDSVDNDFDYDLCSGRYPPDQEQHGIKGAPKYVENAGFTFDTRTGNFRLAPGSPGAGKGVAIPNFCDTFKGPAPDMGAQDAGTESIIYGVKADFVPPRSPPAKDGPAGPTGR